MGWRGLASTWIGAALLAFGCGSSPNAYHLAKGEAALDPPDPLQFVLLADTQYAVPFTDYDVHYLVGTQSVSLGPEITTLFERSFYRHAAAHWAVPLTVEKIVEDERKAGATFGLFGGDLVEFSCGQEADRMFQALEHQPDLPFMVALGNHDVVFHGSYDTDGIGLGGDGPWDTYSFDLWGQVCEHAGGRLTKTGFIRRLLAYYGRVWGLDFKAVLQLRPEDDYPLGIPLTGVVTSTKAPEWQLAFAFRLSPRDDPRSHRQSYLYQRWTRRMRAELPPDLDVTVLDTTDYGATTALCEPSSRFMQVGLSGAISTAQVEWLEDLPRPEKTSMVLSHYMPFEGIDNVSACQQSSGEHCLRERLARAFGPSTYFYAHVHKPFRGETLTPIECERGEDGKQSCSEPSGAPAHQLVRLPSLIDNKAYAVYQGEGFEARQLPAHPGLESETPLEKDASNRCQGRFRELVEIERNLACLKGQTCPSLATAIANRATEGKALCEEQQFDASCLDWLIGDRFRCELRRRADALSATHDDAAAILQVVHTRPEGKLELPFR